MNSSNSSSYDPAAEELDAGDQEPGFGAFDGFLEVLGEASVSAEPSEGRFDDLSSCGARPSLGWRALCLTRPPESQMGAKPPPITAADLPIDKAVFWGP